MSRPRCPRRGATLAEVAIAAGITGLLLACASGALVHGRRTTDRVEQVREGLRQGRRAQRIFRRDLGRGLRPDSWTLTPDQLRGDLAAAFEVDGTTRHRPYSLRAVGAPGATWLVRDGDAVAGPFGGLRFEQEGLTLRLVIELPHPAGGAPTLLTASAGVPASRLPGTRGWTR